MSQILLYTTVGCHLCEQAHELLLPVIEHLNASGMTKGQDLVVKLVEISEQEELVEAYGLRIPVIKIAGQSNDLGWPFDAEQAFVFLSQEAAKL